MSRFSVCVYAICKNEAQFVDRWMDSMSEADKIVVLDTGSTDNTVELLKKRGADVTVAKIKPWRFDVARNRSLELVPDNIDICVCTDLDEVFHPGWRKLLEDAWNDNAKRARYRYTWSFTPEGQEGVVFYIEKIHSRHGWKWTHPVHEILHWEGEGSAGLPITAEGIQVDHRPDPNKSRGQYLPLLELSVKEEPNDDRNAYYLGREYLFRSRWDDCINTLKRHLSMPSATWCDERSASMRCIAKAYIGKGDKKSARNWYLRAIAEAPHLREPYMDLSIMLYSENDWDGVLYFTECALKIQNRTDSYICEAESWGSLPWDIRAMALYYTGRIDEAVFASEKALECEPENQRLKNNVKILSDIFGKKCIQKKY